MYKVIKYFTDLQDGSHAYNVGDTYPRVGVTPTAARIKELSTAANKQGIPLIAQVQEDTEEASKRTRKKKAE